MIKILFFQPDLDKFSKCLRKSVILNCLGCDLFLGDIFLKVWKIFHIIYRSLMGRFRYPPIGRFSIFSIYFNFDLILPFRRNDRWTQWNTPLTLTHTRHMRARTCFSTGNVLYFCDFQEVKRKLNANSKKLITRKSKYFFTPANLLLESMTPESTNVWEYSFFQFPITCKWLSRHTSRILIIFLSYSI